MTLHSVSRAPRAVVRLAVVGMTLAVLALGALSLWSAHVTERESDDLASAGVQTTGQLRAVQALSKIRSALRVLEDEGVADERLAQLRAAQRLLPEGLARMEAGEAQEAIDVAHRARPLADALDPAIHLYITDPRGDILYTGEDDDDTTEDAVEDIMGAAGDPAQQRVRPR